MIRLCSAGFGGSAFSDIFGASVDPGIVHQLLGAAGNYQGDFNSVLRQMLKVGFSMRDLSAIAAPDYTTGSLIYREEVEGDVAGSTYLSLTSATNKCLVLPQSISWSAGGHAQLSLMMHFLSVDGVAAPLTVGTTAGDLSAVSNVYVCDTPCVESVQLNFGFGVRFCNDGKLYPSKVYITQQAPSLSLTTTDESHITTGNVAPGTVGTLSAVFAAVAEGGVRGATRTYSLTGHVTRSVSGNAPGMVTLACSGKGGFTIS